MDYRDDRAALHHRVAQLEDELANARREGREEAEEKVARLQTELGAMRAEVQKLRGGRPAGSSRIYAAAGVAVAVGTLAMGYVLARTPTSAHQVMPVATPRVEVPPAITVAPTPVPTPVKAPARTTKARWNANVTRADGVGVAPGSACTIDAELLTHGTNIEVRDLSVQCGAQSLYRASDALNGMSQQGDDAREVLGASDTQSVFTLQYRDIGPRTGVRTQIDLDSTKAQGSVFRETIPRFRVDFSLPTNSLATTPLEHRLKRTGKVKAVTGAAPAKEGASCTFRAMPVGSETECAADLVCGDKALWSPRSPVKCTYANDRPSSVVGVDANAFALEGSTLTVRAKTYETTIELD